MSFVTISTTQEVLIQRLVIAGRRGHLVHHLVHLGDPRNVTVEHSLAAKIQLRDVVLGVAHVGGVLRQRLLSQALLTHLLDLAGGLLSNNILIDGQD